MMYVVEPTRIVRYNNSGQHNRIFAGHRNGSLGLRVPPEWPRLPKDLASADGPKRGFDPQVARCPFSAHIESATQNLDTGPVRLISSNRIAHWVNVTWWYLSCYRKTKNGSRNGIRLPKVALEGVTLYTLGAFNREL